MFTTPHHAKLIPARLVAERYDVCVRTIDRWLDQGILPPPVVINNRRYFYLADLEKLERASLRANATDNELTEPAPSG
jgi:DNA-binding transcriptional MerR regulator